VGQGTPPRRIDAVMNAASDVLAMLAEGLDTGRAPTDTDAPLQRIAASARALRSQATYAADGVQRTRAAVLAGVEALASQLRAAMESATHAITGDEEAVRLHAPQPPALRLRAPVSILRANLTLRTAACRHAVRLACCFALADALGRTLDLPRGYWVPMTVAIVLKPDVAATFTHGLGRVAGTTVGLVLATGLVYSVFGEIPGRIVLVGVCMFVIRALGPANDGLLVIAVTALVVVLTSFAGARPEATIVARGIGTLIGGALALSAYAVWPTWERTQTPLILADLLDAYRHYVATIMAGDGDPRHGDPSTLETARRAWPGRTPKRRSIVCIVSRHGPRRPSTARTACSPTRIASCIAPWPWKRPSMTTYTPRSRPRCGSSSTMSRPRCGPSARRCVTHRPRSPICPTCARTNAPWPTARPRSQARTLRRVSPATEARSSSPRRTA